MKKFKIYYSAFLITILLISLSYVSADSTSASWTRAYCKYNAGSGGYSCDSGNVGGNSASCNAANGVQCAEEGDVYCYGQSSCEVQGITDSGPTNAYNVNWDTDSADCSCKVGSGLWNIGGEVGGTSCCTDDSGEYKRTRSCNSWCSSDSGDDACCNANTKCVYSSTCYSSAACYSTLAYCNSGTWYSTDTGQTYCDGCVGAGRWNIGGEVSATACCGRNSGEYKKTRVCTSGCTSDSNDDACCNADTKCTYSSVCYTSSSKICAGTAAINCNSGNWEQIEDCATKTSYDSDGGADFLTAGYVADYASCSGSICQSTNYSDSCSVDTLTEYTASGSSYSSTTKNCNDYDANTCVCATGATLTETCDNWNCGSNRCQDSGSDWTRNTWASDGLCTQQLCQGTNYKNYHTNAGSNTWGTSAEATETACNDGYDNNCNGQWDYDTMDRGPAGNVPAHGESNCAVGMTAIGLSSAQKCPGEMVTVECTSSVADVNSVDARLDQNKDGVYTNDEKCNFIDWQGSKARFNCSVGTSTGSKNVNCSVDTAKSYKSGADRITSVTVGGTGCCSGYGSSGTCDADTDCDWCPECSSTKYSGGADRCVTAGSCGYYCWKGKCTATCDDTQGGCIGAQTCETNCSCSSGSCNPDTTKPCCDYDSGYLPDQSVSKSIFNFDNICPPTQTCYDIAWLFEASSGNCCGDDNSEYWINRSCASGCTTATADDACCNANDKCVYNSACYSSGVCYSSQYYCNAGSWYDPDASQTACDTCKGIDLWDIGGEVAQTTCCGDDANEYLKTRIGGADIPTGFTTDTYDDACCNANNKCVQNTVCYASGSASGTIPTKAYCDLGTWKGGDAGSTQCSGILGIGFWSLGGEADATTCCGDDSNQYKRTRVCSSGCTSDSNDDSCCNANNKCTYSSICYSPASKICVGNAGINCNSGNWEQIEDCAAKTSYDSDGGANFLTAGYVADYTSCSIGLCQSTNYSDSCSVDTLTEYTASGSSYSSTAKNCNDYDTNACACTTGATLTETCDNWNCGSSRCQDSGSDWTRNTWASDGLCTQQLCQGTNYKNYHTNAGSNTWGASAEATETACNDGYDNNCNGKWDYDTMDRGPAGNVPTHGESNCAVGVTAIGLSSSEKCPGEMVTVECTSSVADINSIDAYLDKNRDSTYTADELCNFIDWQGSKARFNCSVGTSLGAKNVNCSINTAKSYKSGTDKITQITVGGTSCCMSYGSSGTCEGDTDCDWCPQCSGTKYSGDVDRCVATGTCGYYCWKGKCTATCDDTQGGCIGAQTCEANCSCSSGSCNPDTNKPCCDYDSGYSPNQNVSRAIADFDNICPPNETCFDLLWLFESGKGSCCGDDANEYWLSRNCSSSCTTLLTDEACCNVATDCVYNKTCYASSSCYSSQFYCSSGLWYDSDALKAYCDSCIGTGLWNIGGDIDSTACCGDDANNFKHTKVGGTDAPTGFTTDANDDSCCTTNSSCSLNSACSLSGSTSGTVPAKAYCNAGTWEGGDAGSTQCSAVVGANHWALPLGDVAQTSCCGDDNNEYYAGIDNGRSCDGTSACCNSSFKYSNGGKCVIACWGGFAIGKWFFLGLGPEGSGQKKVKFEISDSNNPLSIITNDEISADEFHHVAVTFSNKTKEARIFIDGRLVKSGIIDRDISAENNLSYLIGHTNFAFNGTMDEVRVYNRLLDEAEIRNRYEYDKQIIYGNLPGQNEATLIEAEAAAAERGAVSPIVKVGKKEKICDITSKEDLPKCLE